jgi:type IX secretion system PorP/SprF family membrane protein
MKVKVLIVSLGLAALSFGQDIHFSNMDYSPLTLNPALAGANNDIRVITNYRTQWNSVGAPYETIALSGDMRLNTNKRTKKGHLAVGLNFFNDRAGVQQISTNNANLSVAYHLMVEKEHTVGLGMYTGFGGRNLDAAGGQWSNQYQNGAYNQALPSGENFQNPNFSYFDVGAGMVYTYNSQETGMRANDGIRVNAGYAVFHVNRPDFSFIGNGEDPLYMRHSIFANSTIGIGSTTMSIDPGVYVQFQGPSREILFGADYRVLLNEGSKVTGRIKRSSVSLGGFFRNQDAFITRVMFDYAGFGVGFAYDFNVSSLSEISRGRGGAEFFLRWAMDNPFTASRARIN